MKRAALGFSVLVLALAVVVGTWMARSEEWGELPAALPEQAAAAWDEAAGPVVQAPEPELPDANSLAPPQAPALTRTAAEEPAASPVPDPATLIVRVVDKRTVRGLAALPVSIDGLESTRTRTDLQGTATLRVPSNLEWRLRVRPNEYHNVYVQRSVPPLEPGERRELVVEASLMEREDFFGRVLDAETRRPVLEAQVFAGAEPAALASSDAEGVFDIPISGESSRLLRIRAAGYADKLHGTRPGHDSRNRACELLLVRSAALIARLQGTPLDTWPRYEVSCASVSPTHSGVSLAMGIYAGGEEPLNTARCDEEGVARMEGLPSEALVLRVWHDGKLLPLRLPSLQLSPGESRELSVDLDGGCSLRGRTVDPNGVPIGRVSVWLMPLLPNASPVAGILDGRRVSARATSDESGHFVIDGVVPGSWQLSPSAEGITFVGNVRLVSFQGTRRLGYDSSDRLPGTAATVPARSDVAPWIQNIVVPSGARSFDVELVVHCDRWIAGRVIDSLGNPVYGVSVFAWDGGEQGSSSTDEAGEFSLGPLGPGNFHVWASDVFNSRGFAAPRAADVGASDVVLELRPAGRCELLYGGAAPTADYSVSQNGVPIVSGALARGVRERLSLPQGLLRVEFRPHGSSTGYVREIESSAIEARALTLREGE